jgi:glucuronate isomerase
MSYLSDNFLLPSRQAQTLYHDYAETMPILDYHCHLSPKEIAQDINFRTVTEVWLKGDHYKWRAMRSNGVNEHSITGGAEDGEKFTEWARTLTRALRNPLYDWAHLELKRYFGIDRLLSEATAAGIYAECNEKLKDTSFSARNLLKRMNVRSIFTTDDPVDDLSWHDRLKRDKFDIAVLPTFRADKAMAVDDPAAFNEYLGRLEIASGVAVTSYAALLEALDKRHEYFHANGCRSSDNGVEALAPDPGPSSGITAIFAAVRSGKTVGADDVARFRTAVLLELCAMNHKRGWAQLLHFGVARNVCSRLFRQRGPDAGVDCIGDFPFAKPLCALLDRLDAAGRLAKTVLFNANPAENDLVVSVIGAFQDGSIPGKIQHGPAWWFLDQKDGMTRQINALSGLGLLGRFIGMTTDSRSLLSFPRHEYFRRLLCGLLGDEMDRGDLPDDRDLVGGMVRNICYDNAREYFGIG